MEPAFADLSVPRYSKRNLPPYRHLPFFNPNPFLDENGHFDGGAFILPECFSEATWRECEEYLYSIDLFNHGFWWEAHVYLKQLCTVTGRESPLGRFLVGLVLIAAAMLHYFMVDTESAAMLAQMGLEKMREAHGCSLGIDIESLANDMQQCLRSDLPEYPRIRLAGL